MTSVSEKTGKTKFKLELSTAERFGKRLRVWRRAEGLPLKRVSHDLDVSVSVVSQWERGLRFPSVKNLDRIAQYMDLPVCSLLYEGKGNCPNRNRDA
jgi:transcriptional regulator with XRE-family HTH domain